MKLKNLAAILFILLLLCFSGCADEDEFYLGNGKNKEDIYDDIFNGNGSEDEEHKKEEPSNDPVLPDNAPDKVYFTESGTVWHSRIDCSHIKKSAKLIEGTLAQAFDEGKLKQCATCLAADEKLNEEEMPEGDVGEDNETVPEDGDSATPPTSDGDHREEDALPPKDDGEKENNGENPPTEDDGENEDNGEDPPTEDDGKTENDDISNEDDAETEMPKEDLPEPPQASDFDQTIFVYYTDNKDLWHLDDKCECIDDGEPVHKIYLFEIRYCGKEKPCAACVKK